MRKYTTLFILFLAISCAHGQSKNEIKEHNIRSTTIWEYEYAGGREIKKKDTFKKFNAKGQVTEFIDYNKEGKQKERVVFNYNESHDLVEEIYYDNSNKLEKTYKYTYDGELKKTKEKYDNNNKLVWKKVYMYEI